MSEAIAYCDQCSKRIPDADIKSGEAIVSPDGAICATCAEALGPEKRAALKRLVGGDRTGRPRTPPQATRKRSKPSTTKMQAIPRRKRTRATASHPSVDHPRAKSKAGTMAMAGVVVGLLVGVLAFMMSSSDTSRSGRKRSKPRPPPMTRMSTNTASVSRTAAVAFKEAEDYERDHPNDVAGAIKKYEAVISGFPKTPEAGKARLQIYVIRLQSPSGSRRR